MSSDLTRPEAEVTGIQRGRSRIGQYVLSTNAAPVVLGCVGLGRIARLPVDDLAVEVHRNTVEGRGPARRAGEHVVDALFVRIAAGRWRAIHGQPRSVIQRHAHGARVLRRGPYRVEVDR